MMLWNFHTGAILLKIKYPMVIYAPILSNTVMAVVQDSNLIPFFIY